MPDMAEPVIRVSDLTYRYGQHVAVDSVSLSVAPGEIYALLGTNGAGKTTTLEIIEGMRRPGQGSVRMLGADPAQEPTVRRRAGIMLQESGFGAELTVLETLRLFGSLTGRKDDLDRVIAEVELDHRRDVQVGSLSGGEKRRLDFALAIYGEPDLIIMDEPTTGLDPESRARLWAIAVGHARRGAGILVTTHYLEEAESHADRIGLMHAGRLVREGTLRELVVAVPATIRLHVGAGEAPEGAEVADGWATWSCPAGEVRETLARLLAWAERSGHRLDSLEVRPASLAQIFHSIAGTGEADV